MEKQQLHIELPADELSFALESGQTTLLVGQAEALALKSDPYFRVGSNGREVEAYAWRIDEVAKRQTIVHFEVADGVIRLPPHEFEYFKRAEESQTRVFDSRNFQEGAKVIVSDGRNGSEFAAILQVDPTRGKARVVRFSRIEAGMA